jgi:prepilin-type processing-associated H-X9-DG protein
MNRRTAKAFTLIELLVVVSILIVLIALLMPAVNSAWGAVRLTQCTSNLSRIGQAYTTRCGDQTSGVQQVLDTGWWTIGLLPYLESKADFLNCPEMDLASSGSSDGSGGTGGSGGSNGSNGSSGQTNSPSVADLFEFKIDTGGQVFYEPFTQGVFVLKMSGTQWNDARSKGYLTEPADNLRTLYPSCSTYQPDSNPNLYWLCLEDHGGDWDFKDVMVKITITGQDTISLWAMSVSTGYTDYIIKKAGSTGGEQDLMVHNTSGITFNFTIPGIGGGGGGDTNYGMNTNAGTSRDGNGNYVTSLAGATDPNGKILAMDYDRYVIRGDDLWTDTDFHATTTGIPGFARHLGMVNVLFTDGAVSLHDPAELDPRVTSIRLKYYDY